MQITVNRKSLLSALSLVAPCVPSRTTKEILKHCRIVAESGALTIETNDLEKSARVLVPEAESRADGKAVMQFAALRSMTDSLTGDTVAIEVNCTKAMILGERAKFSLGVGTESEFPSMMKADSKHVVKVNGAALASAMRRLGPYCDANEITRFAFGGALLDVSKDSFHACAGNGGRIAIQRLSAASSDSVTAIIPMDACSLIGKMFADHDAEIEIGISDNLVSIDVGTSRVVTRQCEGRWPRWRDVIPKTVDSSCTVPAGAMVQAVSQAMLAVDRDPMALPHVDFVVKGGLIQLHAQNSESESSVELPIGDGKCEYTGAFAGDKLLRIFRSYAPEEMVSMSFTEDAATVIEAGDFRVLLMGLRPRGKL